AYWRQLTPANFAGNLRSLSTDMWSAHFLSVAQPTRLDAVCWIGVCVGVVAAVTGATRSRQSRRMLVVFAFVPAALAVQAVTLNGLSGKRALGLVPLVVMATVGAIDAVLPRLLRGPAVGLGL